MSVWAATAFIAFRIVLRELQLDPDGPTELQLDAKAILDGAGMEKVVRRQRYQAVRLAMLRQWIADSIRHPVKALKERVRGPLGLLDARVHKNVRVRHGRNASAN